MSFFFFYKLTILQLLYYIYIYSYYILIHIKLGNKLLITKHSILFNISGYGYIHNISYLIFYKLITIIAIRLDILNKRLQLKTYRKNNS